jgi:molecular chaperone GrpE
MSEKEPDNSAAERTEPVADEPQQGGEAAVDETPDPQTLLAERDDLLARLQRVSADYLNYQKRQQRQETEARRYANAELARDLLAVLDDMERALEAAEADHDADDPLLAGMRLVYDKALEVLARHGVRPIPAAGEPFDPLRHEAMMQQPSEKHDRPTVLQELQRGYELNGRVLRPARVIVSARPEPPGEPTDDEGKGD